MRFCKKSVWHPEPATLNVGFSRHGSVPNKKTNLFFLSWRWQRLGLKEFICSEKATGLIHWKLIFQKKDFLLRLGRFIENWIFHWGFWFEKKLSLRFFWETTWHHDLVASRSLGLHHWRRERCTLCLLLSDSVSTAENLTFCGFGKEKQICTLW